MDGTRLRLERAFREYILLSHGHDANLIQRRNPSFSGSVFSVRKQKTVSESQTLRHCVMDKLGLLKNPDAYIISNPVCISVWFAENRIHITLLKGFFVTVDYLSREFFLSSKSSSTTFPSRETLPTHRPTVVITLMTFIPLCWVPLTSPCSAICVFKTSSSAYKASISFWCLSSS